MLSVKTNRFIFRNDVTNLKTSLPGFQGVDIDGFLSERRQVLARLQSLLQIEPGNCIKNQSCWV